MKKRDKTKQNKLQKITTKRALYEKSRKQKYAAKKILAKSSELKSEK